MGTEAVSLNTVLEYVDKLVRRTSFFSNLITL